jgi:hypothetical protein
VQLDVILTAVLGGVQLTETEVTVGWPTIANVVEADLTEFWLETAVTVALPEDGTVAGAV